MARQHRADAVEERIARGEHADLPPARGQHLARSPRANGLGQGRASPRMSGAARREMALAAEHDLGARRPGRARSALKPSTPSSPMPTMDSQRVGAAGSRHDRLSARHAHPHPRRHGGGAAARRARLAGRADLAVTLSLAGRTAAPAAASPCRCGCGGFGGAEGLARYLRERTHRRADRRHASLRRRRSPPMPRAPPRSPACRCSRCAARPGAQVAGDDWIEVDDDARHAVQALGASAAARVSRARPQGARALRRRAAALLSRAQRRSGRSAARRAARDLHHRARTIQREQRIARCSRATASRRSSPRTAAATRPTARSRRRARFGLPVIMLKRPALPEVAVASRRSRRSLAWLDHAHRRFRPRAACRPAALGPSRAISRVSREPTMIERRHVGGNVGGRRRAS